ncbi:TPA: hypothetical protein KDY05_002151 [Vibrio parahaemolyticus]|nr:hypothetical protein [Vibrio parahaemolyticus]
MAQPYFIPTQDQLSTMESVLGKHLIGKNLHLRNIVLEMLQYSEGETQWLSAQSKDLLLPSSEQCSRYEREIPEQLWVYTDPSVSQVLIHFTKPSCLESQHDKQDADLVIYDSETSSQPPIFESNEWAYIANLYTVQAVTVAMPSIEEYGVDMAATDTGCLEFLSEQLFLKRVDDSFCPTPSNRGDDGSTTIWIELTRNRSESHLTSKE